MRKSRLLSATAISLCLAATAPLTVGQIAIADTTVSSDTTSPQKTSSTGNLTLSSTLTLTSGTAITVDSANTVDVSGTIEMSASASNSTAILVDGGTTSGLTVSGAVKVTDDYYATDLYYLDSSGNVVSGTDGVVDAPWAQGTGRYGIRSLGLTPFIGDITLTSASSFDVEGNESYAVRFENQIVGNYNHRGSVTLIGDNSTAVSLEAGVTGNVRIGSTISVLGANSSAVKLTGDIGGSLILDGSIYGSGYSTTTTLADDYHKKLVDNLNMLQDGVLVDISSNVTNGILLNAVVSDDSSSTSTDQNGNGLEDDAEGTASLTQYGSAPALRIASATQDLTIGNIAVDETLTYEEDSDGNATSTGKYDEYSLVIRGSVFASGVYSGVNSTAIQIGGLGHSVNLATGILITGSVSSGSRNADTTALSLQSGAYVPELKLIAGSISASVTNTDDVRTTSSGTTASNHAGNENYSSNTAYAVNIASGAYLPIINLKAGASLSATGYGTYSNATVIRDQSNTLTSLTSNGYITASITPGDADEDDVTDDAANRPIAIDTRSNTAALALTLTDIEDDSYSAPYIYGDVLLGSGNDVVTLQGASIVGNIDFGAGANSLTMSSVGDIQSTILGKLTSAGTVSIDLTDSKLVLAKGSSLTSTSLHVDKDSGLYMVLDTENPTTPIINGTGSVVFDDGATLSLSLSKIIQTPTKFTVLTGSHISLGTMQTDLSGYVPYIYGGALSTDAANSTLYADFHIKTLSESGLSGNEYNALNAVLTAAATDEGSTNAILAPTEKDAFLKIYSQFLPDYSGESFLTLAKGAEGVGRAIAVQSRLPNAGQTLFWVQESGFNVRRDHGDVTGFEATGFNFTGGRERGLGAGQAAGYYVSLTSAAPLDNYALAKEKYDTFEFGLGGYWRLYNGPLKAWAHLGAGYTTFATTREALSSYVTHVSEAEWKGLSVTGGAGASLRYTLGPVSLKPQASLNYYSLKEDAHTETGGGDSFDLSVAARNSYLLTERLQLNIGRKNALALIQPEVWVGYANNAAVKLSDTVAHFNNGEDFRLSGLLQKGGGPVAGFRIAADNEYSHFSLESEYEKQPDYTNVSVSLRARFEF